MPPSTSSLLQSCRIGIFGVAILLATLLLRVDAAPLLDWRAEMSEGQHRLELQDLPGAESCFRHALHDLRRTPGAKADDVADCMQRLAGVLQIQDVTEDAIPLYKKSLRVLERAHGKGSARLLPGLVALGNVYEMDGDYKPALKLYRRAVAIAQADPGPRSLVLADCQHRLGRATFETGSYRKAGELYDAALANVMDQTSLPSASLLDQLLSDYTDLLRKAPDQEKIIASAFQKELLKDDLGALKQTRGVLPSRWSKEVSGRLAAQGNGAATEEQRPSPRELIESPRPTSPIVPSRPLADFAALEEINKQRVIFYERMIAIDIDSLGPDHPSVARDLGGLAAVYLAQKQYGKAEPLLRRALEIYESNYGRSALLAERTRSLIEMISQDPILQDSLPVSHDDYASRLPRIPVQAQTVETAIRLNYLAFLCYSQGRIGEAERIYSWALAATALASGEQSMLAASCMTDYSRVLRSAGRTTEADRMEDDANVILRRVLSLEAARSLLQ